MHEINEDNKIIIWLQLAIRKIHVLAQQISLALSLYRMHETQNSYVILSILDHFYPVTGWEEVWKLNLKVGLLISRFI